MITYRLAEKEDSEAVRRILHEIDKAFPIPLSSKTDIDELAEKFVSVGLVYMAWDDKRPVGMLGFYANDLEKKVAYFSVLGISADYKRRGIAKALMTGGLDISRERGMKSCFLYTHKTNAGAVAMYEGMGFTAETDPDRPHDIKFTKNL